MLSLFETAIAIGIIVISFSFGIILSYYGYIFFKLKNDILITHRRGNIVILYNICSIIVLFIGIPSSILVDCLLLPEDSTLYYITDLINDFIFNSFYYASLGLFLLRYWIIYHDIKFSKSCLNSDWKKIINNDSQILSINNNKRIGDTEIITKRVIISFLFVSAVSTTFSLLYSPFNIITLKLWSFVWIIVYISSFLFIVITYIKTPKIADNIYLYKEFKILSHFSLFLSLLCIFSAIIPYIFDIKQFILYIEYGISILSSFIIAFISTSWILKHMESVEIAMQIQSKTALKMNNILEDNEMIQGFIQHLIYEFSMENILALIELSEYKTYLTRELNVTDGLAFNFTTNAANDGFKCILFPEYIPKSYIVCGDGMAGTDNPLLKYKTKAFKLFTKYIAIGAPFEANISHQTRVQQTQLMGDYNGFISVESRVNEMDLIVIFDDVMNELLDLLNHSKSRFNME